MFLVVRSPPSPCLSLGVPHLQRPHSNLQAQFLRAPSVNVDGVGSAPLWPFGSLLEDDGDAVLGGLPHSFLPSPLPIRLDDAPEG